jgi:hypothetical protein
VFEQGDAAATAAGLHGAHKAGGAGSHYDDVEYFAERKMIHARQVRLIPLDHRQTNTPSVRSRRRTPDFLGALSGFRPYTGCER